MNCSARCTEGLCREPADGECEDCGDEMCENHLTCGLCDSCMDGYLGLDPEPRPLPQPTKFGRVA